LNSKIERGTVTVPQIESQRTAGLFSEPDSISHQNAVLLAHFLSYSRVMAKAVTPIGNRHVADSISMIPQSLLAFTANAGNNTYGPWVQILGDDDTGFPSGGENIYEFYEIIGVDVYKANQSAPFGIIVAFGENPDSSLTAGNYFDTIYMPGIPPSILSDHTLSTCIRQRVGTKAWLKTWAYGKTSGVLDFYITIIGYPGN
jgi:hypothetical protein